jgi:hypothetical protein
MEMKGLTLNKQMLSDFLYLLLSDQSKSKNLSILFRDDMKKIFELDVSAPTSTSPQWLEKQGKLQTNRMNHACMVFNEAIFISGGNLHLGGTPSYAEIDSVER